MNGAVFAYSRQGAQTARRVRALLGEESALYGAARLQEPDFSPIPDPSAPLYERLFREKSALIFIGSCGIAVRMIAPYVRDKRKDPAVIVIDELGSFVIPILSGHIGGANALAQMLAEGLKARAVVTTATDIHGKFSVDAWAAKNGFAISSMEAAKAVSAAILEGPVPMMCGLPIRGELPSGVTAGSRGPVGIYVGWRREEPFDVTLRLIPPVLHLGIGCRRDTPAQAIARAVDQVTEENGLEPLAFRLAASIDLKKDEAGLLEFCRSRRLPVHFYSAQTLNAVPGRFSPSEFVSRITGVDNVCERAAALGADRLIVNKTACSGVTVAVAAENREVTFG